MPMENKTYLRHTDTNTRKKKVDARLTVCPFGYIVMLMQINDYVIIFKNTSASNHFETEKKNFNDRIVFYAYNILTQGVRQLPKSQKIARKPSTR